MTDAAVAATITVRINGDEREVPEGLRVDGLLEHLGLKPEMVVEEHNGDILRRDALPASAVAEGDAFELVHFVGGG